MIDWLGKNFPAGRNYLVCQSHSEQINLLISDQLIAPFQKGRKHVLWGSIAEKLPLVGKKLGWVPNKINLVFLAETVELELADAFAAQENIFQPGQSHIDQARDILDQFGLTELRANNPFHLSEGETKLVWFLTQWIKQPKFFVVGYLPTGLSQNRIQLIIDFLIKKIDEKNTIPIIILGYHDSQVEWFKTLLPHSDWDIFDRLPEYE